MPADEKARRLLAILESRDKPKGNASRRGELEARPTQALAGLAALLPGHFAASRSLTSAPPPFPPMNSTLADSNVDRPFSYFPIIRSLTPTYSARSDRDQPSNARAALANSGVMRVASLLLALRLSATRADVGRAPQSVKLSGIVYRALFAKSSDARSGSLEFR